MSYDQILYCNFKDCHSILDFSEILDTSQVQNSSDLFVPRNDKNMTYIWDMLEWEQKDDKWYCPKHREVKKSLVDMIVELKNK